jgi:hypothetical protein
MYAKAHHTIAQFPGHNYLPDDRPRKSKFEFGDPANQVELFGSVRQFQFQDFDLENQHRIDNKVNGVRFIIMMKLVTGATQFCDNIQDTTLLTRKEGPIKISS